MKRLSVFGLDVSLHKRRKYETPLSLEDVGVLNDDTVDYLRSLSPQELEDRISSVCVRDLSDTSSVDEKLKEHGIVIVPDFIDSTAISSMAGDLGNLEQVIQEFRNGSEAFHECENYLIQKGACKVSGYDNLATFGKTVIQIRDGQDAGMVDVFNIDHLYRAFGQVIRPAYESAAVSNLMQSKSHQLRAKNLNLYMNSGITRTRGFHVDAYRKKLKSFIYLTDVLSLDDGPYTYVRGSHIDSPYRRINQTVSRYLPNRTETPIIPRDAIIPALARKGTLVISDQGGSHRGFPQKQGHTRMVSVMNYS